ncbi:MetQ/NlpA family ABC transporter substrate-binding protein [Streptococcus dysgalactiae]|uniref:MetQ/NlpA family ABC transporter substrate-binding protein n=1 Tax=Streptococcus dysgalactiae TaxID=1334 RepID=UPI001C4B3A12|nr:MetQ/NlpA family ABC transporter substrate-binding protein [Streptococcus dysgalactiae]
MKKLLSLVLTLLAGFSLVACGSQAKQGDSETSSSTKVKDMTVVKVAAHTSPMTDMLEAVKDNLAKQGYKLEVVTVTDNIQANVALKNKEVDANFFQHKPFMEMFNKGNDANLVQVQPIYDAIVAFYGKDLKDIKDLKEGADVAIPNDPTNMTRALRLLAEHKVISLQDPNSMSVTIEDITENPKNLIFSPVSLLNLNEAYKEKDMIFNYPTYIAKLNLTPEKDGVLVEEGNDHFFAVSLVAREDNKDSKAVKAVQQALTSKEIKTFIEDKLNGHAKVAF